MGGKPSTGPLVHERHNEHGEAGSALQGAQCMESLLPRLEDTVQSIPRRKTGECLEGCFRTSRPQVLKLVLGTKGTYQ